MIQVASTAPDPGSAIFRNGLREKEPTTEGALFSSIIGNIFNGSEGFLQVVVQHGGFKYDPFAVSLALAIGRYCIKLVDGSARVTLMDEE